MKKILVVFFCIFSYIVTTFASEKALHTAVASNFLNMFNSISLDIEKISGYKVIINFDSSANLYSKLKYGAVFDLLITADKNHFILLNKELDCFSFDLSFVGKLAFFLQKSCVKKNFLIHLKLYKKLAIANKNLAPYGYASLEVFENLKLSYFDYIYGNNINQTFVFVNSGNSDIGCVSLSQLLCNVVSDNYFYIVPSYLYFFVKQTFIAFNDDIVLYEIDNFLRSLYMKFIIENGGYKFLND